MKAHIEPVLDTSAEPAVRGFLHRPEVPDGDALVLAHGAGSNAQSPVLIAVAEAFAEAGVIVLRIDLPFRQSRPHGPPFPAMAARDRQGIRRASEFIRPLTTRQLFLGGHSYGGRQTTMLVADEPQLASGLLLLSYPLHPPRKPEQKRDAHFPKLQRPAFFVHGSRDPFGSPEEMRQAVALIGARTELLICEGAGHDLGKGAQLRDLAREVLKAFQQFIS
ncbi:MAG TPA: alpha/beta fold hydrolase [Terriglobales bacterium]|nr:alpha/beta fold hydrolase [Terriglobales bacterium]